MYFLLFLTPEVDIPYQFLLGMPPSYSFLPSVYRASHPKIEKWNFFRALSLHHFLLSHTLSHLAHFSNPKFKFSAFFRWVTLMCSAWSLPTCLTAWKMLPGRNPGQSWSLLLPGITVLCCLVVQHLRTCASDILTSFTVVYICRRPTLVLVTYSCLKAAIYTNSF